MTSYHVLRGGKVWARSLDRESDVIPQGDFLMRVPRLEESAGIRAEGGVRAEGRRDVLREGGMT